MAKRRKWPIIFAFGVILSLTLGGIVLIPHSFGSFGSFFDLALSGETPSSPNFPVIGIDTPMNTSIMSGTGVRWIRADVSLNTTYFDKFLTTYTNYSVIGKLDYTTVGAVDSNSSCVSGCNWTIQDWQNDVYQAVHDYPQVHTWEIWNEPQNPNKLSGFLNGSTYNYFIMLKDAYQIIKAHNSSDVVLALGGDNLFQLVSGSKYPGIEMYNYQWAESVWSYGAAQFCDGISVHAYSGDMYLLSDYPEGPTGIVSNETMGQIFNIAIQSYENLTQKPIWVTETGMPDNNGTDFSAPPGAHVDNNLEKQAVFLNQSFSLFMSKPYVKAVVWYDGIDRNSANHYDMDFGLFSSQGQARPSFYMLESFAKLSTKVPVSVTLSPFPGSNPLTSGNNFEITYTLNGKALNEQYDGVELTFLADPSSSVTISSTSSASNSNEKWCVVSACSPTTFKVSAQGNFTACYYYDLLQQKASESILGGGTPSGSLDNVSYITAPLTPLQNYDNIITSLPLTSSVQSIWASRGSEVVVPSIIDGISGEQWMSPAQTTWNINTSDQISIPILYYHQYSVTPTFTLDHIWTPVNPTYVYYSLGQKTNATATGGAKPVFIDAGSYVSYNLLLSGSNSSTRWITSTSSFLINAPATLNPVYYGQLGSSFLYTISDGGSGYDSASLTYVSENKTTVGPVGPIPTQFWLDYGTSWTISNVLPGSSSTQRWATSETSGKMWVTSTLSVPYYHQYSFAVAYSTSDGSQPPSSPSLTSTAFGSSSRNGLSASAIYWFDSGSTWQLQQTVKPSTGDERWSTPATTSGTVTTPVSLVAVYYHQFFVPIDYNVLGGGREYSKPTLTYEVSGKSTSAPIYLNPSSYWMDAGHSWSATNPLPGSGNSERWFSSDASGSIASSNPITVAYQNQYYFSMQENLLNAGNLSPSSNWFDNGTSIGITVSSNTGYAFDSWMGSGTNAYTGKSSSYSLIVFGSLNEMANFTKLAVSPTYNVSFVETGLPVGGAWQVTLDGELQSSTNDSITFYGVGSGTFNWTVLSSYQIDPATRYLIVGTAGGQLNVPSELEVSLSYEQQSLITVSVNPPDTGNVTDSGQNWVTDGQPILVIANASGGYIFNTWMASNSSSLSPFNLTSNTALVTVWGSSELVANFVPNPFNNSSSTTTNSTTTTSTSSSSSDSETSGSSISTITSSTSTVTSDTSEDSYSASSSDSGNATQGSSFFAFTSLIFSQPEFTFPLLTSSSIFLVGLLVLRKLNVYSHH